MNRTVRPDASPGRRPNGWTGGQYSVFRVGFGAYLFVHYAMLLPYGAELFSSAGMLPEGALSPLLFAFPNLLAVCDAPAFVAALLATAAGLAILFAAGRFDRAAALGLCYIGACLLGRNPLIANPALPYVGWLLLAHACLPPAPFGALAARGRADPGGGWRMPGELFAAAWVVMAVGYTYSGATKLLSPSWLDGSALAQVLANPLARDTILRGWLLELPAPCLALASYGVLALELGFAPLALFRDARPALWLGMLLAHLGLIALIDFTDLSLGMVVLHAFTFDPAWIHPRPARRDELVLYDGGCGLCHGFVRFLLAEDAAGALRFAPLDHARVRARLPEAVRDGSTQSIVVLRDGAPALLRSDAVLHLLARLGGIWRVAAALARLAPAALRDGIYDAVAARRRGLAPAPAGACPLVPARLRARFLTPDVGAGARRYARPRN